MKEMWKGEKTRKRRKQLLDGLKEKRKIMELERGRTRSHSLEN
jgi:hypothetical protein